MSNLKSQFATSSSAASYIPKLEIPNRNTKFYVRLLFVFTVYHTFFSGNSYNLISPVFLSSQNTNEYRCNRNDNGKYQSSCIWLYRSHDTLSSPAFSQNYKSPMLY